MQESVGNSTVTSTSSSLKFQIQVNLQVPRYISKIELNIGRPAPGQLGHSHSFNGSCCNATKKVANRGRALRPFLPYVQNNGRGARPT